MERLREEEEKKEKNNFNKIYSDSKIEIIQKTSTYNTLYSKIVKE